MAEIEKGFNSWLRKKSRQTPQQPPNTAQTIKCKLCDLEIPDATELLYGKHVKSQHADNLEEMAADEKGGPEAKIKALWEMAVRSAGAGDR
jgi:hypothetical protein